MNTTISKSEKEALDELFVAMKKRESLLERLQDRKEYIICLLKTVLERHKTTTLKG